MKRKSIKRSALEQAIRTRLVSLQEPGLDAQVHQLANYTLDLLDNVLVTELGKNKENRYQVCKDLEAPWSRRWCVVDIVLNKVQASKWSSRARARRYVKRLSPLADIAGVL